MAISLRNPDELIYGGAASLYADTKAEVLAEDATITTSNAGVKTFIEGSTAITPLGEVLILDSAGAWHEI